MQNLSILGSTGSIGTQALDVIKKNPDLFRVKAISCYNNINLLRNQIDEFSPEIVAVYDKDMAEDLRKQVDIEVLEGLEGLRTLAKIDSADTVLNSLVGSVGVLPTYDALKADKKMLLANKETLVSAGELIMKVGKKIIPIDSEHSAIFQCLNGERENFVKRIVLTCSGGAFRNKTKEELKSVTVDDALNHPNWNMGNKITIDSATLMNKGFEVIEARMLFGVNYDEIDVLLHPQSIVHSMVEFKDTSVIAQMGVPDMKVPIQYALSYPERIENDFLSLDLTKVNQLTFENVDYERFPCLPYAYEAGKIGGSMPCVMNAANEIAVKAFLNKKIKFTDIAGIIKREMDLHKKIDYPDIDEIMDIDKRIKEKLEKEVLT